MLFDPSAGGRFEDVEEPEKHESREQAIPPCGNEGKGKKHASNLIDHDELWIIAT
jgi:hypothetical protein